MGRRWYFMAVWGSKVPNASAQYCGSGVLASMLSGRIDFSINARWVRYVCSDWQFGTALYLCWDWEQHLYALNLFDGDFFYINRRRGLVNWGYVVFVTIYGYVVCLLVDIFSNFIQFLAFMACHITATSENFQEFPISSPFQYYFQHSSKCYQNN